MAKQKLLNSLNAFFEIRAVKIVFGLLGLFLAYVFASWAVDTGSLLDYAITLLLIFVSVRELATGIFNKKHVR